MTWGTHQGGVKVTLMLLCRHHFHMSTEIFLGSHLRGILETGRVSNQDYSEVSTRFLKVEKNVWIDTSVVGDSRPIVISNSVPQVFNIGPPVDCFSMSQQDEYSVPPPPAEARSTLHKDETEIGFTPTQKLTGFMAWLKEGISPVILPAP